MKNESHRWASRELLQDIQERAALFYDGRTAYVFDNSTKQLLPVDRDNVDTQLFLNGYGISPVDDLSRHALNSIRLRVQQPQGPRASERSSAAWLFITSVYRKLLPTTRRAVAAKTGGVVNLLNKIDGLCEPSLASWNRIGEWLRRIDSLGRAV